MSLLLDALRQAEKNKDSKSIDDFGTEKESKSDASESKPSNSTEMEILPNFDLSSEKKSKNIQQTEDTEQNTKPDLTDVNDSALPQTDLEETENTLVELSIIQQDTIEAESISDVIREPEAINVTTVAESSNNTKTPESDAETKVEETILPVSDTESSVVEEKTLTNNSDDAKNILEVSSQNNTKNIYWILIILVLAILAAAGYLYSLTVPASYHDEPDYLNADMIDDTLITGEIAPTTDLAQTEHQKKLASPVHQPDHLGNIQNQGVMNTNQTRNNTSLTKHPVSKTETPHANNSFSEFSIVADNNKVDYPDAVKVKIRRQSSAEFIKLKQAYTAYQNKNYSTAKTLYTQILQKNHANTDALNALGDLEMKTGNSTRARVFFEKSLQHDGNQVFPQQALIRLENSQSPQDQESHFKSLTETHPNQAQTHATLGSLYLSQQRWKEAQGSYFNAVALDPDNPDYQYNLAISLEHLEKPDIALRYYQRALELSQNKTALFDKTIVQTRIKQLQVQ